MENRPATPLTATTKPRSLYDVATPPAFFIGFATLGAVVIVVASFYLFPNMDAVAVVSATLLYLLFASIMAWLLKATYPHQKLGLCNITTLSRLVIVGILLGALFNVMPPTWMTLTLAVFALTLDGVDGWLARRQNLASQFGATFDVEVDAVFALTLAFYAALSGSAYGIVIFLGLPHYLFWIARLRLQWLNGTLRPSFARKAVCVFQIAVLIATQLPFLTKLQIDLLIGTAVAALLWSFGRDIHWLWKTRT